MADVSRGLSFGAAETVTNTKLHNLVDDATVTNIVNADIAAGAAIVDTKLADITTGNKVGGTSLFGLPSIPSGSGGIPPANLASLPSDKFTDLASLASLAGIFPWFGIVSSLSSGAGIGYSGGNTAEPVTIIPKGGIIIWSGAVSDIPTGWAICDGNNGTPDLTDRFVIHADADAAGTNNVGDTGGAHSVTLTEAQHASHSHGVPLQGSGSSLETHAAKGASGTPATLTSDSSGSGNSHENRPAFYALAYIMKL